MQLGQYDLFNQGQKFTTTQLVNDFYEKMLKNTDIILYLHI